MYSLSLLSSSSSGFIDDSISFLKIISTAPFGHITAISADGQA
jgi:hypothetical protein